MFLWFAVGTVPKAKEEFIFSILLIVVVEKSVLVGKMTIFLNVGTYFELGICSTFFIWTQFGNLIRITVVIELTLFILCPVRYIVL